jgi:hypothetical protein
MEIGDDIIDFVESGISVLVGTRSDRLLPNCCRGVAARYDRDAAELIVFLPAAIAAQNLADLEHNRRIAVCFSRAIDHRSLQLKGDVKSIEPADEDDRRTILQYRRAFTEAWGTIGIPPRITLRVAHWPAHRIRVRVDAIFNQTPGPGAGATLGK